MEQERGTRDRCEADETKRVTVERSTNEGAIIMRTGSVLGRECKAIVYRKYNGGDASLHKSKSPWNKD